MSYLVACSSFLDDFRPSRSFRRHRDGPKRKGKQDKERIGLRVKDVRLFSFPGPGCERVGCRPSDGGSMVSGHAQSRRRAGKGGTQRGDTASHGWRARPARHGPVEPTPVPAFPPDRPSGGEE